MSSIAASEDFWALRHSLAQPPEELELAIDLLASAADALLRSDIVTASAYVKKADLPVLHEYARFVMAGSKHIVRSRPMLALVASAPRSMSRMPSAAMIRSIHARDGWRCRFCGCRVVLPAARDKLRAAVPDAVPWSAARYHGALLAVCATADHVVPHSLGGGNEAGNIVTACWPCNFGRGNLRLEEVGVIDPFSRPPAVDKWDGLGRLLSSSPSATVVRPAVPDKGMGNRPITAKTCAAALDRQARILIELLDDSRDIGATWILKKVLLVRIEIGGARHDLIGITADGQVHLPWMIQDRKLQCRAFAETIAAAHPDAVVRETPKHWTVRKSDGTCVSVAELIEVWPAVRAAIQAFRCPDPVDVGLASRLAAASPTAARNQSAAAAGSPC